MNLVSVIIPTYNRAHLVCEAISSVLHQTYQNFEIIVVDDGSTDNTREKLEPYQDRIKYVYIENGGPAHARNVGMKMAMGKYISFLDSDDLYYPYKTEIQANFLDRNHDISLVCTEFSAFNNYEFKEEFHLKKFHKSTYKNKEMVYEKIFSESTSLSEAGFSFTKWPNRKIYIGNIFDKYLQNLIVCATSIMFRNNILKHVGLQEKQYGLFHDYEFILRICKLSKVAFIDVPTYQYRYHEGQISTTKKDKTNLAIRIQRDLLKVTEKHGLNDKDYYYKNKEMVDRQLAKLNRALVIPLMAVCGNDKIAREHLKNCAKYGKHEYLLWFLTFTPHIFRRIAFKILSY